MFKKIFKEPLVHFALLGLLLFVLFRLVNYDETDTAIVIDQYDLNEMIAKWNLQWSRDPTADELKGLLDSYIKQEIYYREALAMRLDHDDEVVKRRMAQKMKFLTQDVVSQVEPSEEELIRYMEDNAKSFTREKEISFKHVYFSPDRRQNALADAKAALDSQKPDGDHPPIPSEFNETSISKIRANFGQDFAENIGELVVADYWQGPITSGYGYHIVLIEKIIEARPYLFEEVKDQVKNDYQYDFQLRMNDELFNTLLEKYEVVLDFEDDNL